MSDFEMPVTEKSKDSATLPRNKTKAKDVPAKLEKDESEPKQDPTPEPKYSEAELLQIFDTMLFEGSYSESITIRGRLKVSFRTRTAEEMQKVTHEIDGTSAVLMATVVEHRNLLNLYYALTTYQGKDISRLSYDDRVSYINKLPAPVVGMMMVALFNFDSKVAEATKEGEENF